MIDFMSVNQLMMKIAPLPQPYSSLRGNQICMSILDASHRTVSITPKYKYQDQLMMTLSIQKQMSTINKIIIG